MKYMGSKNRIADEILIYILRKRTSSKICYVEPFCGGCNIIDKAGGRRIANDINKYLIAMWKELVGGWIPDYVQQDEWKEMKKNIDKYPDHLVGWVGFNCSFRGLFFSGYAGLSQTRHKVRDYQKETTTNIFKQLPNLMDVKFTNLNYDMINIPNNSIVYCDPPYKDTSGYKKGVSENISFDHDLFWDWVKFLDKQGHIVYVSEYTAPDYMKCIWAKNITVRLGVNHTSFTTKQSVEKLFTFEKYAPINLFDCIGK